MSAARAAAMASQGEDQHELSPPFPLVPTGRRPRDGTGRLPARCPRCQRRPRGPRRPTENACCGEKDSLGYDDPSHPNTNEPGLWGPGGGRVGAVALSPFIEPGTKSNVSYNHYSLLKTIEMIFGLSPLGDARQPQVHPFGADVFTR